MDEVPRNILKSRIWRQIGLALAAFVTLGILLPQLVWPLAVVFAALIYAIVSFRQDTQVSRSANKKNMANQSRANENAAIHHAIVEALQFPAYILDRKGNVAYANQSSVSAFGKVKQGDKIFIRFRQPGLRKVIEDALQDGQPSQVEYNEAIPDDRWYAVEISPIPQLNSLEIGEQVFYILGFHDLTEAKRTDQMRSDFIANASHELRTPLASLMGYLETLQGPARNDEKARDKFTGVMLDQAQRMTRLINDLLSLSRIEMQAHVRPSDSVDLVEIISSVISSLRGVVEGMGVEIEFDGNGEAPVIGDRDELHQVFENLIENACKYGEDGRRVVVTLDKISRPGSVIASVQDFGPGIAIEHQHRITERFYRVDVARSREKQGTGLGLAIVKHILNRHGTRLGVESAPGEGARFFARFDLVE